MKGAKHDVEFGECFIVHVAFAPRVQVHFRRAQHGEVLSRVCELIVHSSLERKESRGPFFRTDFPATDNRNWLVANVLKKSGNGLLFEQRPYQLPFFSPGFDVRDNLQVAW